jgi:carbamoyl-phosphate synthase large subunit
MINCNPETVSTDYDTADRLYFEPLTFEDVLEVWHVEHSTGRRAGGPGVVGVIVALGGQTPLGLARRLEAAGAPIVGTSPESIHLAEDRGAFGKLLAQAGLRAPAHGTATSFDEAKLTADDIGYPVLVRPSYVLGGRGMEIVYDEPTLRSYITRATEVSPEHPVLVDRFLDDAIEIDVDALVDAGGEVFIGGIMEHIEEAGIHSGDSACALPPITLATADLAMVRSYTSAIQVQTVLDHLQMALHRVQMVLHHVQLLCTTYKRLCTTYKRLCTTYKRLCTAYKSFPTAYQRDSTAYKWLNSRRGPNF